MLGQAGALRGPIDYSEGFDSSISQRLDGFNDGISLKGLSFAEAYLKGVLWIALEYRPSGANVNKLPSFLGLFNIQSDVFKPAACFRPGVIDKIKPLYFHSGGGWDENNVLIGDVEFMQAVKPKCPTFMGLYLIEDSDDDFVAWRSSLLFMSIDLAFKRLPILAKGEFSIFVKRCAVGFGSDVVSVIKGCMEVMQRISENRGSMFRECSRPVDAPLFQKVALAFGTNSFQVITDVLPKDGFELSDVMFGPFDLQIGAE